MPKPASSCRPATRPRAAWSVYILRCRDGSLYTGIATDVPRRLAEHAAGSPRGAKYLRGRGPLQLVFTAGVPTREAALRLEARIKRMPKAGKEALVRRARVRATPPPRIRVPETASVVPDPIVR